LAQLLPSHFNSEGFFTRFCWQQLTLLVRDLILPETVSVLFFLRNFHAQFAVLLHGDQSWCFKKGGIWVWPGVKLVHCVGVIMLWPTWGVQLQCCVNRVSKSKLAGPFSRGDTIITNVTFNLLYHYHTLLYHYHSFSVCFRTATSSMPYARTRTHLSTTWMTCLKLSSTWCTLTMIMLALVR
jgi:hypothetical protein